MKHATPHAGTPAGTFTQLLSSTRRGARLARLLAVRELHSWGAPDDLTDRAELVVAELAANAVLHGRVPGRGFRLALAFDPSAPCLRVEVTDARGESYPRIPPAAPEAAPLPPRAVHPDPLRPGPLPPGTLPPDALRSGGRGLALVAALADRWDCVPHPPSGKTVRAVLTSPAAGA
ncbi:ATP-binding protein [Streptomyces sudanensis]|uniref:ATP-binding protein n=1 Tax=Streptomyces sudanensis TaxID=436397 RepID=UPI0020CE8B6D|nr:ATP-binding protein [Streptomyces sudanensis]MCP9956794.1 ATP-binding protein [Streptomyces sudanensis]